MILFDCYTQIVPFILEMFKNDKSLYGRIVIVSFFPDVLYKV